MDKKKHYFGCGFLLGFVLFGLSATTAVIRGGTWKIGIPIILVGAFLFGILSARYGDYFWEKLTQIIDWFYGWLK